MDQVTLVMLGTGNAAVTRCYNTCFTLCSDEGVFLVDAGGGNGILVQLERAGISLKEIRGLFVTHAHTDHILGAVWVLRMVAQQMQKGEFDGGFRVYGHDKVMEVLRWICRATLPAKIVSCIEQRVCFCEVKDGDGFQTVGMQVRCFDIASTKEKQFGFRALLPGGKTLVCLGDEPYNERTRPYVEGADWLLCEAFCLYADRERFKPYEKHHSTALDAGRLAEELGVKNLLLYHTEDKTLSVRKQCYAQEAARGFKGRVWVPDDLERIILEEGAVIEK